MNRHALAALEFPKVKELVLAQARSAAGLKAGAAWGPAGNEEEVRRLLAETAEMTALAGEEGGLEFSGLVLPDEILKRARPLGACLTPAEIIAVSRICILSRLCRTKLQPLSGRFPLMAAGARSLPGLLLLEKQINKVLNEEGAFRENASAVLAGIKRRAASLREEIHDLYQELFSRHASDGIFQDDIVALRGGRYVLLVKAQHRARLPGAVLDRTDSGAAVYLEPRQAAGLNERLLDLAAEEEHEKRRLLSALTVSIRENQNAVKAAAEILGSLDLIQARARYGLAGRHHGPEFNGSGTLRLMGARHPLLERALGEAVVPLRLEIGREERALVVTGPNTGGKTVALKTVGLLCLMAQSGLYIPADEGSSLPVFRDIYADIGDEQSIEQSLSTFSAHIRNIAEAVAGAGDGNLIILDELGAGTDPAEGAPLAMAILEHFIAHGALTVASTHQGALVAFAASTPGAVNASMEFESGTLQPTYRLVMGVPGRSNAREVARKMGLPASIISRSRELEPEAQRGVAGLVADLSQRRREMEAAMGGLASREADVSRLLDRHRRELEGLRQGKEAIIREARAEAKGVVKAAREKMKDILAQAGSKGGRAHHQIHRVAAQIEAALPQTEGKPTRPLAGLPQVGQKVRLFPRGTEGLVLAVSRNKKKVKIEVRGKVVEVPLGRLEEAEDPSRKAREPISRGNFSSGGGELDSTRLDIRGKRMDEAMALVTRFIDLAWQSGLESVEILHGKGLGLLREACAKLLAGHPGVKDAEPAPIERGGHGVTVVSLK